MRETQEVRKDVESPKAPLPNPTRAEELAGVLRKKRRANGIVTHEEVEAERALAGAVVMIGRIRVITIPHSQIETVSDRLTVSAIATGVPAPPYIIFSRDHEGRTVRFSGDPLLAEALSTRFRNGFVGISDWSGYANRVEVEHFLHKWVQHAPHCHA